MSFDRDDLAAQSYEIIEELQIRQILETRTNWQYEFTKNSRYDYDLQLFNWGQTPRDDESRELIGYVEIEVANEDSDWQTGALPESWNTVNLLARKVYEYNGRAASPQWGGPKEDYWRTIYLKFNHQLDNCFAVAVDDAHRAVQYRGGQLMTLYDDNPRNWTFLKLDPEDESITYGIDACVQFITDHLTQIAERGRKTDMAAFAAGGGEA